VCSCWVAELDFPCLSQQVCRCVGFVEWLWVVGDVEERGEDLWVAFDGGASLRGGDVIELVMRFS